MIICTDIAERREKCLTYLVKNYDCWPTADTRSVGARLDTHHGYRWRKTVAVVGTWQMFNKDDIIYEADYAKAWEDSVRMSDHFEPGDMLATYSPQQTRAALHAIRQYDGMKAKLDHTREVIRLLTSELEKPV